jgi:hypothetical protein
MTSKNEHTGDKLQTKPASEEYLNNYDKIFCKHIWEYQQDKDFDWYQCSKCGLVRDKAYVP